MSAERSDREDDPDCWNLALELRSSRPSREVFEQLVAGGDRWDLRVDSGWRANFWRHREQNDPPEEWFGVSGVWSVYVYLDPLSDPTCYPIPADRFIESAAIGG